MSGLGIAEGYAAYALLALAGCALTLVAAVALRQTRCAGWLADAAATCRRWRPGTGPSGRVAGKAAGLALAVAVLAAGPLMVYHATVAPVLGMVDGANHVVCCFDGRDGVLTTTDGAFAARGGRLVDLARGTLLPGDDGRSPALRARSAIRFDSGSAYFGDVAAPSRIGVFAGERPLSVQLGDGTTVGLANPSGNCVVIAEDGPVAAVVVSAPRRSPLDALLPLRGAGTIDFVDLRTGRTLRSVTVARLDGFSCTRGPAGASLVGTAGGSRWVLSQERWIKVFDVRVPRPVRELRRALAFNDAA